MPTFEDIKRFYNLHLWTDEMVRKAYEKNVITEEQLNEILNTNTVEESQPKESEYQDISNNITAENEELNDILSEDIGSEIDQ